MAGDVSSSSPYCFVVDGRRDLAAVSILFMAAFQNWPSRAAKLVSLGAFCLCQQPSFCVLAVIYYVKEGWLQGWWRRQQWGCEVVGAGEGGDTDLPLINADGDQGERQDDED